MQIEHLSIPDILLLTPRRFADERGFFSETYNLRTMAQAGIDVAFVQDNHSLSRQRGVIRGLHCQLPPHAQGKLVRCTRGAIWDVAVDARQGSPSFGRWVAAELSEENGSQLWIPPGFLHGFCTLTENAEVQYKCTDLWDRDCERSVRWNSPDLAIAWPVAPEDAVLSEKDAAAPDFSTVRDWF
ncbi:dTDP-4-dehydrorhamnose 3,5-epimerase [Gluconacetobacter diazotrophicus PA1 5]|uniref:dTDP-4-dehydrorhamnose 3,5-epimerase n=2 Tax=Gluconacetobacter diazotrophicus TaxID=33996 RepID=A9H3H9_GLUDA|nr:dTDP-4-dehydrorhamnose 3,5-epimerase [Gluconacetobacter diazotrophicus]ACI52724.1 dTDP-4-dehydrorhamnose 3,5-epimerase [Gluconacetobacter diazotrophicus PA1 5]MBB2157871.1 dTDP-4-dehydrorhamnose 3,5-epimerase [Gluconacetobacter diazotrophicus]TWB06152.1 dTDP-4-dehydrorhamnose 3,5-epimerase [Gluconacetobacter diazotrophicus]CAP57319.1 dTDP-4-dehydrorhamnose 3,5-epimerase [Gluconacetobacter diazotrophicus PA1 5]